jgi:uncharacterized protein (DUF1499 family)
MSQRSRTWRRRSTLTAGTLLVVVLAALLLVRLFAGNVAPPAIGMAEGELSPCPDTDNCARTTATDPRHAAEPVTCPDAEVGALVEVLERDLPRTTRVAQVGTYAHLEVRSQVFGFVDDLELLVEDDQVQLRSASRIGADDLGVNRERVEDVRTLLTDSAACG